MSKIHTSQQIIMIYATSFAFSVKISLLLFSLCWSPAGSAGAHFNLYGKQCRFSVRVDPACDPTSYLIMENWWDIRRQQHISQQETEGSLSGINVILISRGLYQQLLGSRSGARERCCRDRHPPTSLRAGGDPRTGGAALGPH